MSSRIPPRSRRARGFTLLEVMVALALLATALMAVSDLIGGALKNHAFARELTTATLLAREKLAELEARYEDQGFRDFDEEDGGDFAESGHPEVRWHVRLVAPSGDLSADQVFAALAGGGDPQDLLAKLTSGAAAASAGAAGGQGAPVTSASPLAGAVTGLLQTQLTAFGETVKKSLREMRLTVSWGDGKGPRAFTVTTHLVVLNPKAPGGARGDDPEVPPNLAAAAAASGALQNAAGAASKTTTGGTTKSGAPP